MHDQTKWKIYQIAIVVVIMIGVGLSVRHFLHTIHEQFKNHPVLRQDQEISGYVRAVVDTDARGRNSQFIILGDSQRIQVLVDDQGSINHFGYDLQDVLRKDTYISKLADNDTIMIYDYRDTFYFLLHERLTK
ncbi:MAG: hypothetical protein ACYC1Q_06385 [Bacteroidia bacterium]